MSEINFWKQKFLQIVNRDGKNVRRNSHNWTKIFSEWIVSEGSLQEFLKARKIHITTPQKLGGRIFWNDARQAVRRAAMAILIEKAPDVVAEKYSKNFKMVDDASDLVSMLIGQLKTELNSDKPKERKFLETRLATLTEAIHLLNESTMRLKSDGIQQHKITTQSQSLHAVLVESMRERDAKFGLEE